MSGIFFVVATPIGNLQDVSSRALDTLRAVHKIFCEDTRVTRRLLEKYDIKIPYESYHQHSPQSKISQIISLLAEGQDLALVTDAGTPGIADPGNYLIQELLKEIPDLKIVPIPGANAALAALSVSGFPTDNFSFLGFPPAKKRRQRFFQELLQRKETVVFYESPHRIIRTLTDLAAAGGAERRAVVARELTKIHETIYRGAVAEILEILSKSTPRGEFVIVISNKMLNT